MVGVLGTLREESGGGSPQEGMPALRQQLSQVQRTGALHQCHLQQAGGGRQRQWLACVCLPATCCASRRMPLAASRAGQEKGAIGSASSRS